MKRVCLLACCAVLSGCLHAAPEQGKQVPPPPAVKQEKPELSATLVEKSIVKGKTTREELAARLGPPNSVEKHPYHVPKITAPGFKMEIPTAMMAVETWNYWRATKMAADNVVERVLVVKIHLDENYVVLDYEISEKDIKEPQI